MAKHCFPGVLVAGLFLIGFGQVQADPVQSEQLAPPRELARPAMPAPPVYYVYPRVSRYAVWQDYGVNRYGKFRPLVIDSPYGAYYRYNHEPFPWVQMYPGEVNPEVLGSPTGRPPVRR
jgi:hypothetical protein